MQDTHDDSAQVVSSNVPWQGRLWSMREDQILLPDAKTPIFRQYMQHPGAISILALDEQERVLMINQYRHPVRARLWEIPAGLLDHGNEDFLDAAKRELREEADLEASRWDLLVDAFLSPGCSSESVRMFLARDLHECETAFEREDEELGIVKEWVPVDRVVEMIFAGNIHNPSTIMGVLALNAAKVNHFQDLRPTIAPWFR